MSDTKEHWERLDEKVKDLEEALEGAAPITTKQRKGLPKSSFAVPGKRKLPLDTCARVRNAMARFGQTQGLTSDEKRTAYNKIIRAANKCGIDPSGFRKKYGGRYS
jgi:hypothetical protein